MSVSKTIAIADFNIDAEFMKDMVHNHWSTEETVDVETFNNFVDEYKDTIIEEAQDYIDDEDPDEIPHIALEYWKDFQ